jgi:hypothetical protein
MEDKLIDILQDFKNDKNYNELNAVDDIFRLFSVVERSEQFYCWDGEVGEHVCEKQCEDCRLDDRSKKQ